MPGLVKLIGDKDIGFNAVTILGTIGPAAKEAVPVITDLISKPGAGGYGVEAVAVALARIDAPALDATRRLLVSSGKCDISYLLRSQVLVEYPALVVPQVITLCADKDPKVRAKAALVLNMLRGKLNGGDLKSPLELAGEAAKGAPPALEKMLGDEDVDVRVTAAQSLSSLAPDRAEKTIPIIVALALDDKHAAKVPPGGVFHKYFQPVPTPAAKALIPLLDNANERVRLWAFDALTTLMVQEPFDAALKDGRTVRIRQGVARVLGAQNRYAVGSIPALRAALTDPEFPVRFAAAWALVRVDTRGGETNAAAVPVLIEGLDQTGDAIRVEASQCLMLAGPVAKSAVPALKKLSGSPKSEPQLEAAIALAGIDPKGAAETVPALTEGLKSEPDSEPKVSRIAWWLDYEVEPRAIRIAKVLAELGPVAKSAVTELIKRYDAKDPHLRLHAAEAVGRVDSEQAPKAAKALIKLMRDADFDFYRVRVNSLAAIRRIGPAAKSVAPTLLSMIEEERDVREHAALTLIVVDPDGAQPAFEWFRKALAAEATVNSHALIARLPEIGVAAKPLVPELIVALKSNYYQKDAIRSLAAIGPGAKDALSELKKLAEDGPRPEIKWLAAAAIKKIEVK